MSDRAVLRISGEDAPNFLQGLVTNNVQGLEERQARFAGLLTPQGKLLFDFFIVRSADGYLIDVARSRAQDLIKRLAFYRLRAKVDLNDLSAQMAVGVSWQGESNPPGAIVFDDPRHPELGRRIMGDASLLSGNGDASGYLRHRLSLGIPEGGLDFTFGDIFPHEANMDQLGGIDFDKGCYVGQEVVSRMQHRGSSRKRFVPFDLMTGQDDVQLPPAGEIRAGKALIGTVGLGPMVSNRGLALIRLDRAGEAAESGEILDCEGTAVQLRQPEWAQFTVPGAVPS